MPQKRNPYALPVIRGAAGTLLGRATGVLATQRTPSGRTDNLLYAYGEVCGAIELATRTVDLAAAVTESLAFTRASTLAAGRRSPPTSPRRSRSTHGIDYRIGLQARRPRALAEHGELSEATLGFDPTPVHADGRRPRHAHRHRRRRARPMDAMLADAERARSPPRGRACDHGGTRSRRPRRALRQLAVC